VLPFQGRGGGGILLPQAQIQQGTGILLLSGSGWGCLLQLSKVHPFVLSPGREHVGPAEVIPAVSHELCCGWVECTFGNF